MRYSCVVCITVRVIIFLISTARQIIWSAALRQKGLWSSFLPWDAYLELGEREFVGLSGAHSSTLLYEGGSR